MHTSNKLLYWFQPEAPAVLRASSVKAELSDVEGLGFKLEERLKDIMELRKALKLKVQTVLQSCLCVTSVCRAKS